MTELAKQLTAKLSKTQVDRLGDRLRKGSPTDDDLRTLDDYRQSFGDAYETVVRTLRERLKLEPTGRPAKSTSSIIEKLHRESIRLSQVQDIAGCRVVVADVAEQERVVVSLGVAFPGASLVDRRAKPSYGYRAVHVIAQISGKLIEIQVRSLPQHLWAELSEKFSDVFDPSIKYGGGLPQTRTLLDQVSSIITGHEDNVLAFVRLQQKGLSGQQLQEFRETLNHTRARIVDFFSDIISDLESQKKGQKQ